MVIRRSDGPSVQPVTSHQLTTYSTRSTLTRVIQPCLRLLRPHLVTPKQVQPAGSPPLTPDKVSCTITHRVVKDMYLYDFTPPNITPAEYTRPKQILLYFAGGGFQSLPSKEHWTFCSFMCTELSHSYAISLVSYPLAPNSPASKSLPHLLTLLDDLFKTAASENGSVTLMGDSAGGNIALSLAFSYVKANHQASFEAPSPNFPAPPPQWQLLKNVLVISPPTDLRNTNSAIADADRHDPVLNIPLIDSVAATWAGSLPRDDPAVSPLLDDFAALKRASIRVHGIVGTYDVLAPDALRFRERCEKEGIPGQWCVWEGQMHCFPLAAMYGLPEGKVGRRWVCEVLRRNV